jgi:hypothetical protein
MIENGMNWCVYRGCRKLSGGFGQGWPTPNSWEKGEGEEVVQNL